MRTTLHNGRHSPAGIYPAKHNDRRFNLEHAPHIKPERSNQNFYWHYLQKTQPGMSFEEAEAAFYTEHFAASLQAKNDSYRRHGDQSHIQSIDEYRRAIRSCPEETILMIGQTGDTVSPTILRNICLEQIAWENKTFPNVKILDFAIHVDEQGGPHAHLRRVWIGHDKNGYEVVGQNKALAEMNIPRPEPNKPRSKYNNPKQTYTANCREHFQMLCQKHGLTIETTPKRRGVNGLNLVEYQTQQEEKRLQNLVEAGKTLQAKANTLQNEINKLQDDKKTTSAALLQKKCNLAEIQVNISFNKTERDMAAATLKKIEEERRAQLKKLQLEKKRLQELQQYLSKAEQQRVQELVRQQEEQYDFDYDDFNDYDER